MLLISIPLSCFFHFIYVYRPLIPLPSILSITHLSFILSLSVSHHLFLSLQFIILPLLFSTILTFFPPLPPLSIELQVQEQPPDVRSNIYSHMEAFVPCNKEALLKRLKKLSLNIQVSEAGPSDLIPAKNIFFSQLKPPVNHLKSQSQ